MPGPLQIYRVLGSVAFLNSGKILQPLLAKSQCWCVDGVSKFVLRIRPNAYYRIELPCETPADEQRVEEIKKALKTILHYETTPCPFKRGFTVDLPELPETQKIPWKPKVPLRADKEDVADQDQDRMTPLRSLKREGRVDAYPEDIGVFNDPPTKPQSSVKAQKDRIDAECASTAGRDKGTIESDNTSQGSIPQGDGLVDEPPAFKTPKRPKPLRTGRTVTAPPQLSLRTSPPSTGAIGVSQMVSLDHKMANFSSSVESFHSFHSPISPLPPSPPSPDSSPEIWGQSKLEVEKSRRHKRDTSEATITGRKGELWDLTDASAGEDTEYHSPPDLPTTAKLIKEAVSEEIHQGSRETNASETKLRLRNTRKSRHRPSSPLPSSSNLYPPYSPRAHMSGHHLTTAILQRTCSLLLGPPVQLVALMLRIAAKISRGVFHGTAFGFDDEGQRIPCSWDFSDGSGDDEDERRPENTDDDEEDEDDYGISLGKTVSGKDVRTREIGGSWEID